MNTSPRAGRLAAWIAGWQAAAACLLLPTACRPGPPPALRSGA